MEQMTVTKDMKIGDVVQKYPQSADVMLNYGLHCIGCHVNQYETIEQGAAGHGMPQEQIEKMVSEINEALKAAPKKDEFGISPKAAEKLKEISKQQDKEGHGLRVRIKPGGCAGFQYEMGFVENPEDDDKVFEKDNVKVFIDPESFELLGGANLDYVDSLQGAGFKIDNPNFSSSCGCGNSHG